MYTDTHMDRLQSWIAILVDSQLLKSSWDVRMSTAAQMFSSGAAEPQAGGRMVLMVTSVRHLKHGDVGNASHDTGL